MSKTSIAKFKIGQVIRHRVHAFRGVVFDVDPEFADGAENEQTPYIAYVSEQNLLADTSDEPVSHPQVDDMFERDENGSYRWRRARMN
jgi:heat shock protein HspQ